MPPAIFLSPTRPTTASARSPPRPAPSPPMLPTGIPELPETALVECPDGFAPSRQCHAVPTLRPLPADARDGGRALHGLERCSEFLWPYLSPECRLRENHPCLEQPYGVDARRRAHGQRHVG